MIKLKQANFTLVSFTISIILHIATSIMFLTDDFSCINGSYYTDRLFEVIMLSLFDIGTLLPHLVMPFIFYYLPSKYSGESNAITVPLVRCRLCPGLLTRGSQATNKESVRRIFKQKRTCVKICYTRTNQHSDLYEQSNFYLF